MDEQNNKNLIQSKKQTGDFFFTGECNCCAGTGGKILDGSKKLTICISNTVNKFKNLSVLFYTELLNDMTDFNKF